MRVLHRRHHTDSRGIDFHVRSAHQTPIGASQAGHTRFGRRFTPSSLPRDARARLYSGPMVARDRVGRNERARPDRHGARVPPSEPRVDRLALLRQDREYTLMDAAQRLARDEPLERRESQPELVMRQPTLATE